METLQVNDLTEKQSAFIVAFTSLPGCIGNATKSAVEAGYSEKSAYEIGRQQLEKSHILAAIDEANRSMIGGSLASKAIDVLRAIIDDQDAPAKLRLDAAKTILDRAGISTLKVEDQARPGQKEDLAGMSMEELAIFIRQGNAHLAREARGDGQSLVSH